MSTSVFPGKAADKSKESMNSQDTSQYKTEGRVRMVGLEELFVVTSTGLKRSYNLLPTNKKSKAFWNLEMNSFSEARYPLYYQHQFYSNDVQFNWYPRTDIVLVTRNLVTQSVPESGANQNNVNRNKKQATKNNPIPYGIIGALVNRQQFLQHMDNMLDEYINKNSQNEKLDCDIVNCYLITTDGRMLGTLKAKDSKYLRRNEPLEKFVNDRLDTVDSELWKFLIDDGYFVRKTPDKQMKDNQGMCMLRYQDEIIDNGQKKQNSIIAGKNKETQKVKLSWELTNLEQSQVKYWHPWQARSDPNYIEAFNQYFRCTQTVNEYTFDQSKLNAKKHRNISLNRKCADNNSNTGINYINVSGWIMRFNGERDIPTFYPSKTTTNMLLIVTNKCNDADGLIANNGTTVDQNDEFTKPDGTVIKNGLELVEDASAQEKLKDRSQVTLKKRCIRQGNGVCSVIYGDTGNIKTNAGEHCSGCKYLKQSKTEDYPWQVHLDTKKPICTDYNIDLEILMDTPNNKYKLRSPLEGEKDDWCGSGVNQFGIFNTIGIMVLGRYFLDG